MPISYTEASPKKTRTGKRKTGFLHFLLSFFSTCLVAVLAIIFMLYGPFSYLRYELITKAMATMNHQWIATFFFTPAAINDALSHNKVVEPTSDTDASVIGYGVKVKDNATTLPNSPADGEHIIDGVGFIRLQGDTYNGWAVKIYDPSRLYMALASGIGTEGEKTSHMSQRLGAFVGVNAGGFADAGGQGTGGLPVGVCIVEGHQITGAKDAGVHRITGFDKNNRLILGNYTNSQIKLMNFRYAVEFKPFLIVNGVRSTIIGNGGMGTDPRTAIGQTKQGVIILLIINGRRVNCEGATIKDLQDLMVQFGAYNASNLDGGSSSTLAFNGKVVNNPSSRDGERFVPNAFLVKHTSGYKK